MSQQDIGGFLIGKGCIVEVKSDDNASFAYYVEGLDQGMVEGNQLLLIDSIEISKEDAITPKDALNDKHAIYLYGTTFSYVRIIGTIFLGNNKQSKETTTSSGALQNLTTWFDSKRVVASRGTVKVSIADKFKGNVYITKLTFGRSDPKVNAISFGIEGIVKPSKSSKEYND